MGQHRHCKETPSDLALEWRRAIGWGGGGGNIDPVPLEWRRAGGGGSSEGSWILFL